MREIYQKHKEASAAKPRRLHTLSLTEMQRYFNKEPLNHKAYCRFDKLSVSNENY